MSERYAVVEWANEWYQEPLTYEQEDMASAIIDMSDEEFDEWYNNLINE